MFCKRQIDIHSVIFLIKLFKNKQTKKLKQNKKQPLPPPTKKETNPQ